MISIYLGPHYFFQAPEELWWPATTITGPNDARCVGWALGMCFFFSLVFSLLNNYFYLFRSSLFFLGTRRATVAGDITGPNDASGVVWALLLRYVFFWFFFVFSLTSQ